ncbi:MAG: prepilin-type N-terminal cleavage/methylation domain-containing protein [Gammaproteobacteria bacterium]|nr:prepilin-type N-terminal cleavage/methylation domain-containing protein [Gammaproteobacteria bacterium]
MAERPQYFTQRADGGFTLVEVLISIALFALAMTLLMSGFRFTQRVWDAGERMSQRAAGLEVTHRLLSNMLDRFIPLPVGDPAGFAFIGNERQLRFPARLPPYPATGGVHTLEFRVEQERDETRLTLKMSPFDAERFFDEAEGEAETVLRLADADISFSYGSGDGEETEWRTGWPEEQPPPQLIRLEIATPQQHWPAIIVAPGSEIELACLPVDVTGLCRLNL